MKTLLTILLAMILMNAVWFHHCEGKENKGGKTVKKLPAPRNKGAMSVESCIAKRRSVRSFSDSVLSDEEISQLLWAAQGITDRNRGFRAAPSAGATYPLETYVVTREGVFRYLPQQHALESIKTGDSRGMLAIAALGQSFVRQAPVTIVFSAVPERTTNRYGNRGIMYIHMEAGHAAQNVHLQAVALGLGSVPVGAFDENMAAKAIGVPTGERVVYLVPVGRPSR